ncbi:MAG: ABC transporter permease [Gammaproteobacteria bacterium]
MNWRFELDRWSFRLVFFLIAAVGMFFLVFPTIVVLITSLTASEFLQFPPQEYSLRWYRELKDAIQIRDAALNSFAVAIATAIGSIVLGVAGALAIARSKANWAKGLDMAFMSPLLLPQLAYGFAALMMFSLMGAKLSIWLLIIGHIAVCVPFVIRTTIAALSQLSNSLLESSYSLGAGRMYTFRRVIYPLIRPGVMAGAFLAFMSSFDNVPVSLFLTDPKIEVLPIHLWQIINNQLDPRAASTAGVLIIVTVVLLVIMERVSGVTRYMR